ncbi:hypothetical protein NKI94_19185 [Mesorhizobium australicum]|uniref:hypothetical protein n=1 Tax=Mesorhizobium australicum TaxID=536018 RepID=UPI003335B21D
MVSEPVKRLQESVAKYQATVATALERLPTGVVLTLAASLENHLRNALESHMPGLSSKLAKDLYGTGPLGTFSGKIKIARAFGILPAALAAELTKIKDIRNDFAHSEANLTFQTPDIEKQVRALEIGEQSTAKSSQEIFLKAVSLATSALIAAKKS